MIITTYLYTHEPRREKYVFVKTLYKDDLLFLFDIVSFDLFTLFTS